MAEWLNIFLRTAGFFIVAIFLTRLVGKRLSSRFTFFDLMAGIVMGVMIAAISLNLIPNLVGGIIALGVWILFTSAVYFLSIKYKSVRDIVLGKETVLISHGKVLEENLMKARFTPEDLLSQLRRKNAFNFADVEFAVLEPTGDVSVLLKKDSQPVTPRDIGLTSGYGVVPQTVIMDGVIMDDPLAVMGLNRAWLHTELEKTGVAPENVFIAQVDSLGQLYLDLFNDTIQLPQPKAKELLFSTLKKCQADCEIYALGTRQPQAKIIYGDASRVLSDVVRELGSLLKR